MDTLGESLHGGLPELCSDLLSFASQLRKSGDPEDGQALRLKIDERFRELDARARRADIPQEDVQQAKYALAALIDETILTSPWPLKSAWAERPLQLEYFNDFSAGEEFYNRIDALREKGSVGVLEVYYLCLALGFRGKYVDLQGMEKKKALMDVLAREIHSKRGGQTPHEGLSPSWEPPDTVPDLVRRLPAWLVACGCALFLLILYVTFASLLGGQAGEILK